MAGSGSAGKTFLEDWNVAVNDFSQCEGKSGDSGDCLGLEVLDDDVVNGLDPGPD